MGGTAVTDHLLCLCLPTAPEGDGRTTPGWRLLLFLVFSEDSSGGEGADDEGECGSAETPGGHARIDDKVSVDGHR